MGGEPDGAGATAGGEASVGGAAEGPKTVHVRCSNGNKFSLEVDLSITVRALKVMLAERSEIPADQQRLIYKGRVLKDDNSLDSYGELHAHSLGWERSCFLPYYLGQVSQVLSHTHCLSLTFCYQMAL